MAVTAQRITCFIADDHPPVLRFLCGYLADRDFVVAGSARTGDEALERILELEPRVAILDVRMPGRSGTEIARELTRRNAKTRVVLYTGYGEQALLLEALDAGVGGFVQKEAPLEDLVAAIRVVAGGAIYVDPVLGGVLFQPQAADRLHALSPRQREVLRLLADGRSNDEIGRQLCISPDTVRTHLRKAMGKLDADTRTQAVATAIRQALIQ